MSKVPRLQQNDDGDLQNACDEKRNSFSEDDAKVVRLRYKKDF